MPAQVECDEEAYLGGLRLDLIAERKIFPVDDGYRLTERGRKIAQNEFAKYELRPQMALMLQMYVLEMHEQSRH